MPPWKPEPGYGDFAGDRRLTDAELTLIARWIDSGMQEGDPGDLPRVPEARQWQLGKPDLVVAMPEPYELGLDGGDVFRTFVIPIPVSTGRYVKGVEFLPGTASAVHHATIKIDPTRSSRLRDEDEAGPGYDGGGGRTATFPDGHFLGWTPGQSPAMLPEDMGWRLDPGSDLGSMKPVIAITGRCPLRQGLRHHWSRALGGGGGLLRGLHRNEARAADRAAEHHSKSNGPKKIASRVPPSQLTWRPTRYLE